MKKKKAFCRDRSAGGRILKAAVLCLAVLLAAGGYLDPVDLYPLNNNNDPGGENPWEYSAPEEDGLLVAEAFWPVWVNTGISAEVTYAFYVWSAKG